MSLWVNEIQLY